MRLRFDAASATFKLTCPSSMSARAALAWAVDQRDWIEQQLGKALPFEPFEPGATIPIEGTEIPIRWDEQASRVPVLRSGELVVGGDRAGISRRVSEFLKRLALETMSRDVSDFAQLAGVTATSVSVGDASSRWGSCSSRGTIRLSWRLILAPPQVRRYVVAHEVAHLLHLDHGAKFRALEAQLFGAGLSEAKASLRRIGPRLRLIGRSG